MINNKENILGENIKRLRIEKEIKQAALARELRIGRQTLSSYERGVSLPDIFLLIRIADFFGVSLDELSGRKKLKIPHERSVKEKTNERKKP